MSRVNVSGGLQYAARNIPRIIAALLAVVTLVGIGSMVLTAYFGVPMGDDYLAIKTYSNKHTWPAEAWHSLTDTGRYMQSVTSSLAYGLFRDKIASILPLIVAVWLYALIYAYLRLANTKLRLELPKMILYIIALPVLLLFISAGRPIDMHQLWLFYQSFFFSSAIVTYTIGLLLYLTFVYFALTSQWFHKKSIYLQTALVFGATYIVGLYNEVTPATLFGLSIVALVILYAVPHAKKWRGAGKAKLLLAATAGATFLSLLTMYFSPASIARRQAVSSMSSTASGLFQGVSKNLSIVLSSTMLRPSDIVLITGLGVVIVALLMPAKNRHHLRPRVVLTVGVAILFAGLLSLVASLTMIALGYGAMTGIYPRVMLIPQLLMITGAIIIAIAAAAWLYASPRRQLIRLVALVIIGIGMVVVTPHHISRSAAHLSGVQDYNALWEVQDTTLRQRAKSDPDTTVYTDDAVAGIGDGFSTKCTGPYAQSTIWLSDGMEAYYGLHQICAKSDLEAK